MPQIIPIRDLKDTNAISERCHASSEPIFVTKNGYSDLVVMSMETYEKTLWLHDVYDRLAHAEEQLLTGKTRTAEDSMKELRKAYGV